MRLVPRGRSPFTELCVCGSFFLDADPSPNYHNRSWRGELVPDHGAVWVAVAVINDRLFDAFAFWTSFGGLEDDAGPDGEIAGAGATPNDLKTHTLD